MGPHAPSGAFAEVSSHHRRQSSQAGSSADSLTMIRSSRVGPVWTSVRPTTELFKARKQAVENFATATLHRTAASATGSLRGDTGLRTEEESSASDDGARSDIRHGQRKRRGAGGKRIVRTIACQRCICRGIGSAGRGVADQQMARSDSAQVRAQHTQHQTPVVVGGEGPSGGGGSGIDKAFVLLHRPYGRRTGTQASVRLPRVENERYAIQELRRAQRIGKAVRYGYGNEAIANGEIGGGVDGKSIYGGIRGGRAGLRRATQSAHENGKSQRK